jgi:hypothetical protein
MSILYMLPIALAGFPFGPVTRPPNQIRRL